MVTLTIKTQEVERLLGRLPTTLEKQTFLGLRDASDDFLTKMRLRVRRGGASGLNFGTGRLAGSLNKEIRRDGSLGGLRARIFSAGVPYARIHEFGGTIRPTGGRRFLTIPGKHAQRHGVVVTEVPAAQSRDDPSRDTFVHRTKRGKLVILERTAQGLKVLWHLVPKVTIPARLGFFDTWRGLAERRRAIYRRALSASLREAKT